ncbi:hypothetical protein D0862_04734 [Hortaea werneckii]|uniref:Synaptobrevin n=1 Tax=Hortaea werneckii TaxID=91943 RepID=A0A3M7GZD2_HORWE|nr:hypothetical protein D0862_04734 [Hortaea werneckii]
MDQNSTLTLNRLLTKLDSTLIQSPDPKLGSSQYERARISANLEHARTLLLTLEKQSATIRTQSQRQQAQTDLQQKRDLVKRLSGKLQDLEQSAHGDDSGTDSDSDDGDETQDLLKQYAPARHDAYGGIDRGESQPPISQPTQTSSSSSSAAAAPTPPPPAAQEIRSRRPLQASDNRAAASTTAREHLFANRPSPSQQPTQQGSTRADLASHELQMSHNRHEQDTLTSSMLSLAQALKQSAQQMGVSIESEKDIMKRAEGGLDKSAQGMEAAERRMGMLRRMSEGQGWWGRVKLYGFIFALWVVCFLLVFLGPKLRL